MKQINKINVPESWDEVSFSKYTKLMNVEVDYRDENSLSALDSTIEIISILCDVSIDTIENLSASDYLKLNSIIQFISKPIEHSSKTKWDFIKVDDLKMDKWLAYESYRKDITNNLSKILTLMQSKYSSEDIDKMAVTEVLYGFFILQKKCQKYIRTFQLYFLRKSFKWEMKMKMKNLLSKVHWQKK